VPLEVTQPVSLRTPQVVFASARESGGTLTVHPAFAELFARFNLTSASAFWELPGEVVSGHADRHVMRVELPGESRVFYLKRQHIVGWRERLRNRLAGFGWVSRCAREVSLLRELEAANLPAPRWAAHGTIGNRAFLLVEEVANAIPLRELLSDNTLSPAQHRELAERIGTAIGAVHAAGFRTPDLTAKHILVNRDTLALTFLDWQSAQNPASRERAEHERSLGALQASVPPLNASRATRLRVWNAYCTATATPPERVAKVLTAAQFQAKRRSIRDQTQPQATAQRLVWLAGEAVCAIPEIAAHWPENPLSPPFYGFGANGTSQVRIAGRNATLVRGCENEPLARLRAWWRATPWRSPGVTIGRVLFHLQRYGVPAPQLFAFGQRLTTATQAEWFALYETPPGLPLRKWRFTASSAARRIALQSACECLHRMHESSCVVTDCEHAFAIHDGRVSVANPQAVRIVRRVTANMRKRNARELALLLGVE
jgi:tRNA A-37 threonylcarbamoyl transferase component Bud32